LNPFARLLPRRRGEGKRHGAEARAAEFGSWPLPTNAEGYSGTYATTVSELRVAENSLQTVAVAAATDLLASVSAQLPIDTYRRNLGGRPQLVDNAPIVMDPAGDSYGAPDWIYQYVISKLLRGNVYGEVTGRDSLGYPTGIVLYDPDEVQGWRDPRTGRPVWRVSGRVVPTLWHRRSYPLPGRLLGSSPIERHARTIGQSMAATRFGVQWFAEGGHPTMHLQNTESDLTPVQITEVKNRYLARGTREPLVTGRGWDSKPLSVRANESQFLETLRYSGAECARIFGPNLAELLGYETGGSMTYANVVDRDLAFLKYNLNRWLSDVEEALSSCLPPNMYAQFNRAAILEMDLLSRYKSYAIGIGSKFLLPDEARELEDRPALTAAQKAELAALTVKAPSLGGEDGNAGTAK
jgi:HK97 family phage portal protein